MILLNILPKKIKNELKLTKTYKTVNKFLSIFLFNIILYTAIFSTSYLLLTVKLDSLIVEANNMNKDAELYSIRTKEVNKKISEISQIQDDFISWSSFLFNFTNSTSNGITLKKISIDKENKSINITGTAKKRNDLLNFKTKISEIKYLDGFEIPIKNLLIKENIAFDIKTNFINYEFE